LTFLYYRGIVRIVTGGDMKYLLIILTILLVSGCENIFHDTSDYLSFYNDRNKDQIETNTYSELMTLYMPTLLSYDYYIDLPVTYGNTNFFEAYNLADIDAYGNPLLQYKLAIYYVGDFTEDRWVFGWEFIR
jgi:hypothetical protein